MPTPPATSEPWLFVVVALLSGGGGVAFVGLLRDWVKARRGLTVTVPPDIRDQSVIDSSIASLARTRDELEKENERLRERVAQQEIDKAKLRQEIDRLYDQIQSERQAAALRYDALLERVHTLQQQVASRSPGDPAPGAAPGE